jgi:hypothetical protein
MALSPPSEANWVSGVTASAAFINAQVRDAINFLANPPICACYQTTAQTSIAANTWTPITYTVNKVDTYSGHSTTTNTSRYVAQVPGWYKVSGLIDMVSTGNVLSFAIAKNGAIELGTIGTAYGLNGNVVSGDLPDQNVFLNTGDYVELWAQNAATWSTFVGAIGGTNAASRLDVEWDHV